MKKKILWITRTAVLIALLVTLQWATSGLGQFVTGSCVNAVLYLAVVKVIIPIMGPQLAQKQVQTFTAMFSWPQLVTALIGTTVAVLIAPVIRKAMK